MSQIPKIIMVIEDSSSYCRSLIWGFSEYVRLHGPWTIFRDFHNPAYGPGANLRREFYKRLERIDADGIITRNPKKTEFLTAKGVPTIVAKTELHLAGHLPRLSLDHTGIGQMAARHFLDRGYQNFAYCGFKNELFSNLREDGFRQAVKKADFQVQSYVHPTRNNLRRKGVKYEIENIARWLKSLKKPTALLACSDARAINIMEAAKIAQIHIPEHLAILGVDNDDLLCNTCEIPLSSIHLNAHKAGFKAAQLLHNLIKGEKMTGQVITISPIQVVTRTSTDIMAIEDDEVVKALQFIRENRRKPIQVSDVVEAVTTSRRCLQGKFSDKLGRTILSEIQNTRISLAQELLLDSDMNITEIAQYLNFSGVDSFSRYFKNITNTSPMSFRKDNRND